MFLVVLVTVFSYLSLVGFSSLSLVGYSCEALVMEPWLWSVGYGALVHRQRCGALATAPGGVYRDI